MVASDSHGARLGLLRWGLVSAWADDPAIGSRMITARSETLLDKPSFRKAAVSRRCLVPANGFYEWAKGGDLKVPYWSHSPANDEAGCIERV